MVAVVVAVVVAIGVGVAVGVAVGVVVVVAIGVVVAVVVAIGVAVGVGMNVVCLLYVVFSGFQGDTAVSGKVLKVDKDYYTVDFSKDAIDRGFEGNYSNVVVIKDFCLERGGK